MAKRPVEKYNFKPFGAAIKAARKGRKESRNRVSDEMYISPTLRTRGNIQAFKSFLSSCPAIISLWINSSLGTQQMENPRHAGSLTLWQMN